MPSDIQLGNSTGIVDYQANNTALENAQHILHYSAKTFSGKTDDPRLFQQVSALLLSLENKTSRYPLYSKQHRFSAGKIYTTRHSMILKQQIETLLNNTEILSLL